MKTLILNGSLQTRMAGTGALLLLPVISGIVVRLVGRPPNPAVLAAHKLTAVGSLVLAILAVYTLQKSVGMGALALVLTVFGGLLLIALFVSGALLSSSRPANTALLILHMAAPALIVTAAAAMYWLHRPILRVVHSGTGGL
jgi:hypothetical protein